MNIEALRKLNPTLPIYSVNDREFRQFGRVLTGYDTKDIIKAAKEKNMPETGSVYEASTEAFEALPISDEIAYNCYGEMPTQVGYCYGHSNFLNAWEWHTASEINIAVTDLVLILGDLRDVEDNKIDSSKAKAFLLHEGDMVEVFGTSLHFCPCEVDKAGFGCVVCLPKGTNLPLEKENEDKYLFRKNKWLIAHNENAALIARGVNGGISGENFQVKY